MSGGINYLAKDCSMTINKQHIFGLVGSLYRSILALHIALLAISPVWGQDARTKQKLRSASEAYRASDYAKSTYSFEEALKGDSTTLYAHYGLGNSLYRQGKYEEALRHYERVLQSGVQLTEEQTSALMHNMGNIAMNAKQYNVAIDCYQKALMRVPSDDDARYNLVLAQKLKQQQEQQDKNKEDKQEQDKQDKEKPEQQQKPQPQDNKQNKQNEPQQSPKESQDQAQGRGLTPEQAEQILNAFKQNDDRTRKKVEQLQREQEAQRNNQIRRKW